LCTEYCVTMMVIAQNFISSSTSCGDCLHSWTRDRRDGCLL